MGMVCVASTASIIEISVMVSSVMVSRKGSLTIWQWSAMSLWFCLCECCLLIQIPAVDGLIQSVPVLAAYLLCVNHHHLHLSKRNAPSLPPSLPPFLNICESAVGRWGCDVLVCVTCLCSSFSSWVLLFTLCRRVVCVIGRLLHGTVFPIQRTTLDQGSGQSRGLYKV